MIEYTSTARKDGRWWVVQCDQVPGAVSQVARLDQAGSHQREAIAFVAGLDVSEVSVLVRPLLDADVTRLLEDARTRRRQSEQLARDASAGFRHAAHALAESQLSVRDIGVILGVSHQRAHQLLHTEELASRSTR